MSETYKLEPELSKSSYDEEKYSKNIDGKRVEIIVISFYRWSEFEITLTNNEKEEILSKKKIIKLHVKHDNYIAIKSYKNIGFKITKKNYCKNKLFGYTMSLII